MAKPAGRTLEEHIGALQPFWRIRLPKGEGPFPVIVQLHGCAGLRRFMDGYAEIACGAGAAVLSVDSHRPRRISEATALAAVCTGVRLPGRERAADLFAAMAWLRRQGWADATRIAAAGWSHGGWTISDALGLRDHAEMARATGIGGLVGEPLAGLTSVFLVYPYLGPLALRERPWRMTPRVTAVLCGRDVVAGGKWPRLALSRAQAQGAEVEIVTFETATHAFDEPAARVGFLWHNAGLAARAHALYRDFARNLCRQPVAA